MIHSFLLIGQSNMAGRGLKEEVEPIPNDHIYVLRNGRWLPMYVPVNPDRVTAGINLSESFAYAYLQDHPGVEVGLIPCADGGTSIGQWMPGDVLFDHAVMTAKLAQRSSKIVGILWHQGESDCSDEKRALYAGRFREMAARLREELNLQDVPMLVGGLGDFLANFVGSTGSRVTADNYTKVNDILKSLAEEDPRVEFVSAEGLGDKGDNLHFSAKALREFGLRYYEAFKKLNQEVWETPAQEGPGVNLTEIEKL